MENPKDPLKAQSDLTAKEVIPKHRRPQRPILQLPVDGKTRSGKTITRGIFKISSPQPTKAAQP